MVTFINESNESIDSIFHDFDIAVAEACNECEYDILVEQYNYVCENGVQMPINEAEEKRKSLLAKLIGFLVEDLIRLKDRLIGWCKKNYIKKEIDEIVDTIKSKFNQGKKDIESATTPEEAKEASNKASAEMKNQIA